MNSKLRAVIFVAIVCLVMVCNSIVAYKAGYNQATHDDSVELKKYVERINNQLQLAVEAKERNDAEAKKAYDELKNSLQQLGKEINSLSTTVKNH